MAGLWATWGWSLRLPFEERETWPANHRPSPQVCPNQSTSRRKAGRAAAATVFSRSSHWRLRAHRFDRPEHSCCADCETENAWIDFFTEAKMEWIFLMTLSSVRWAQSRAEPQQTLSDVGFLPFSPGWAGERPGWRRREEQCMERIMLIRDGESIRLGFRKV